MARVLTMVAKEPLEHRGQPIAAGEVFSATLRQVVRWIAQRKVTPAAKGTIATRDLTAADQSSVTNGRAYHRRDMVSER